jgi:hypothetical protein
MKRSNQINLGWMDIPKDYIKYDDETKILFCNDLIDTMLRLIERDLSRAPQINRINFLIQVLESSLITNENMENYEVCSVLRDCINQINDN